MISFLLPTHDRPDSLSRTLAKLGSLSGAAFELVGGAEVIVVDCASSPAASLPDSLGNTWSVRGLRLETNNPAQARNKGAEIAPGDWIVMLDDDSYPLDEGIVDVILNAPPEVAAIGGEILLEDGSHEAGGLPEVFVGCGAALRREAFLEAGGYDETMVFYAEEYDLCARLIKGGWRIEHDARLRVRHHKATAGRDMLRILKMLVRNNAWVMQRYAPAHVKAPLIEETMARYRHIAVKEDALEGYAQGVAQLAETLEGQPRCPMDEMQFDRFTGYAAAREHLERHPQLHPGVSVAVIEEGKQAGIVKRVLRELGVELIEDARAAEVWVIGTLSPGPMMDAMAKHAASGRRVIMPWSLRGVETMRTGSTTIGDHALSRCRSHSL